MKIKVANAAIATLDLVMEMSARQNVIHRFLIYSLSETNAEAVQQMALQNQEVAKELEKIRAKVFQYAEVSQDDLLNGLFDI